MERLSISQSTLNLIEQRRQEFPNYKFIATRMGNDEVVLVINPKTNQGEMLFPNSPLKDGQPFVLQSSSPRSTKGSEISNF